MRGVRHPAPGLRGRNNEHERRRWNRWKAEGIRGRAHEDLRVDGSSRFFLVVNDWTRTMRPYGVVAVMAGQMRMQRLTVMMLRLLRVEMHMRQRRGERSDLHEHDEGGGGQPAKHAAIVVNRRRGRHLTTS